jgi:hypothetical protein
MQESLPDRASWKLTMTSRCKSGQRRHQGTFVAARRRSGRPGASKRGVEPSSGGCNSPVRSMKRSLPRRQTFPRKGPTGSRAQGTRAKAMEGVKNLGTQPRRILRRRGRGTVRQPSWEQERPVSAPAVRPVGCQLTGGLGASNPISGIPGKWARAERESERSIVLTKRGNSRG